MKRSRIAHIIAVATLLMGAATPAHAQPGTVAITSVTLIDGTGAPARDAMTVILRDGRITDVDPSATARIPDGATIVDGSGKFLIPGLWDMHVHLSKAGAGSLPLLVAHGVTSVRDMGGDAAQLLTWRADVDAGRRVGPRIRLAGPMLESPGRVAKMRKRGTVEPVDRFRVEVRDAADAERVVDSLDRMTDPAARTGGP